MLSSAIAAGAQLHPKSAGVLQYGGDWAGAYLLRRSVFMPWELDGLLDPALVAEGLRRLAPLSHIAAALQSGRPLGDFDRVAALETSLYMRNQLLRDADWAGMAHSIEIRVPYVDPFFLAALPPGDVLADDQGQGGGGRRAAAAAAGSEPQPLQDRLRHAGRTVDARRQRRSRRTSPSPTRRAPGHCASGRPAGPARPRPDLDMTARMLALVSDCYGMGGGIARYNQDLVEGLAEGGAQILVLPRHGRHRRHRACRPASARSRRCSTGFGTR